MDKLKKQILDDKNNFGCVELKTNIYNIFRGIHLSWLASFPVVGLFRSQEMCWVNVFWMHVMAANGNIAYAYEMFPFKCRGMCVGQALHSRCTTARWLGLKCRLSNSDCTAWCVCSLECGSAKRPRPPAIKWPQSSGKSAPGWWICEK